LLRRRGFRGASLPVSSGVSMAQGGTVDGIAVALKMTDMKMQDMKAQDIKVQVMKLAQKR